VKPPNEVDHPPIISLQRRMLDRTDIEVLHLVDADRPVSSYVRLAFLIVKGYVIDWTDRGMCDGAS